MGQSSFELYIDDSGSRNPDHKDANRPQRDAFALGGVLIREEDRAEIEDRHAAFLSEHRLIGPLVSSHIRRSKGEFTRLSDPDARDQFMQSLERFLMGLPIRAMGCVIDRAGYNERYKTRYGSDRWMMCRSAYSIVVERAVKLADHHERRLRVFVEMTGDAEDKKIREYHAALRGGGCPFDAISASRYRPVGAETFSRVLLKNPAFRGKRDVVMQIADLVLYPIVQGGYDPNHRPYVSLTQAGAFSRFGEVCGTEVKYYCFP